MGKINVLSFEVANLIAAGEVVERPSSVVKELLENAIDAGGKFLTVEIQNGGVRLIRVTDDGCGMLPEDMPVALRRHATSKIQTADDLSSIMTLGFRGEALAAIAAVSDVTILSKPKEAAEGAILTASCGQVTDICAVGCADGTTVSVENLFLNVPARRKFLKKDATEGMAVAAIVEKVALSRPDIAVRFVSDGVTRFQTAGDGELLNVIYSLYGGDFAKKLLPISGTVDGVTVRGYVGRSDNSRNNRNYQNTFLNGRFVKSKTVTAALEQAFTSYMAPERFPVSFVFLDIEPDRVDVNVHPSKLEVKFSDERTVFEAVYYAVRPALEKASFRPEMTQETKKEIKGGELLRTFAAETADLSRSQIRIGQKAPAPTPYIRPETVAKPASFAPTPTESTVSPVESLRVLRGYRDSMTVKVAMPDEKIPPTDGRPIPTFSENTASSASPKAETEKTPATSDAETPAYRFVGEAFHCYLIVEIGDDELLLIDKHAAHERILFEELKKTVLADGRIGSQSLLLPLSVTLSAEETAMAREYQKEIEAVGFTFTVSDNGAELFAVPSMIELSEAADLFTKICADYAEGKGNPALTAEIRKEKQLYQVACKGAIKGGRRYDDAVHRWLIEKLLALPDITVCPHGRPVAFTVKKRELDRRFDRIK